jgi:hypothetical protein
MAITQGKNQHPERRPIAGTNHLFHRHEQFNFQSFFISFSSPGCPGAKFRREINTANM